MPKPTPKVPRPPKLPKLLDRKIYKTGQTRGADDDVIFQNRVNRDSTVLIPHQCWDACTAGHGGSGFENGFIVLLSPDEYFNNPAIQQELARKNLSLGNNALVFYETRAAWIAHNPTKLGWKPAKNRRNPLGGNYVARIPGTTATADGKPIIRGFDVTSMKGAGIRVYEYASAETIALCRLQLEALFWLCYDADAAVTANGMTPADAATRKAAILSICKEKKLLDLSRLVASRIVNAAQHTTCPLCLDELSSQGFFERMEQAEGRVVPDLTVTEINLFHIEELHINALNHRPYNLGWGHHHCNVVVKDAGILETLEWMKTVLQRNAKAGHIKL